MGFKSSAAAHGPFVFHKVKAYAGLVLICVALQPQILWVLSGDAIRVNHLRITLGRQMDAMYRCHDLNSVLASMWLDEKQYLRLPASTWEGQTSIRNQLARRSQVIGHNWFKSNGFAVDEAIVEQIHFDSVIDGIIRVQEKASSVSSYS